MPDEPETNLIAEYEEQVEQSNFLKRQGAEAWAEMMMGKDKIESHTNKSGKLTHFAEHPTPHKFRHTFAATLLQGGAPIRLVAQYLGDTEETVRKHYSKFCREEQEQAATLLASAYKQYDAQTAAKRKARLRVVK